VVVDDARAKGGDINDGRGRRRKSCGGEFFDGGGRRRGHGMVYIVNLIDSRDIDMYVRVCKLYRGSALISLALYFSAEW
jgi:hypothetical protein